MAASSVLWDLRKPNWRDDKMLLAVKKSVKRAAITFSNSFSKVEVEILVDNYLEYAYYPL